MIVSNKNTIDIGIGTVPGGETTAKPNTTAAFNAATSPAQTPATAASENSNGDPSNSGFLQQLQQLLNFFKLMLMQKGNDQQEPSNEAPGAGGPGKAGGKGKGKGHGKGHECQGKKGKGHRGAEGDKGLVGVLMKVLQFMSKMLEAVAGGAEGTSQQPAQPPQQ